MYITFIYLLKKKKNSDASLIIYTRITEIGKRNECSSETVLGRGKNYVNFLVFFMGEEVVINIVVVVQLLYRCCYKQNFIIFFFALCKSLREYLSIYMSRPFPPTHSSVILICALGIFYHLICICIISVKGGRRV